MVRLFHAEGDLCHLHEDFPMLESGWVIVRMHDLEDLKSNFGLSYDELRYRLGKLGAAIKPYIMRGKRGKILVDDSGLQILRRLRDLEQDGRSISQACQAIQEELQGSHPLGSSTPISTLAKDLKDELIEELRERVKSLEYQLEIKDRQIEQLYRMVEETQQLLKSLPPAKESRKKRWWRFWEKG